MRIFLDEYFSDTRQIKSLSKVNSLGLLGKKSSELGLWWRHWDLLEKIKMRLDRVMGLMLCWNLDYVSSFLNLFSFHLMLCREWIMYESLWANGFLTWFVDIYMYFKNYFIIVGKWRKMKVAEHVICCFVPQWDSDCFNTTSRAKKKIPFFYQHCGMNAVSTTRITDQFLSE